MFLGIFKELFNEIDNAQPLWLRVGVLTAGALPAKGPVGVTTLVEQEL